ncbi:MAG: dihydrolipoyl dehydrogenase family protein [Coriobacteriia bacterium]
MSHYDVLIIGSGAGGQTVADACAKARRSVAVVDRLPFGGTCALRGCIPKKVLFTGAETVARAGRLAGKGVRGSYAVDWPALMAFKRTYTESATPAIEGWMRDAGIATLHGTARFSSANSVVVGSETIQAEAIVIATGAYPMPLGFEGEDAIATSTDFLDLDEMPARVAFVGGGYISFELAGIAHHAGATATILHRSAQVLAGFDPELSNRLADHYRALGIQVLTDAPVIRVERTADGLRVVTSEGAIQADLVVHGAGRIPALDDLDLDVAHVAYSKRGVTVDSQLRSTTNPAVWSVGDAADAGAPLTPVASVQGEVVAANILGGSVEFDGSTTPSVLFSDPPMARVGMDAQAAEENPGLEVRRFDMGEWLSQSRLGNDTAGAALVIDTGTGAIVGAHLLGEGVEELVNILAVAIKFRITMEQLRTVTWSYPTLAYEINYLTGRY